MKSDDFLAWLSAISGMRAGQRTEALAALEKAGGDASSCMKTRGQRREDALADFGRELSTMEPAVAGERAPGDPRILVGERDGDNVGCLAIIARQEAMERVGKFRRRRLHGPAESYSEVVLRIAEAGPPGLEAAPPWTSDERRDEKTVGLRAECTVIASSAGCFSGPDFCLIFAPYSYDDPEILPTRKPPTVSKALTAHTPHCPHSETLRLSLSGMGGGRPKSLYESKRALRATSLCARR